MNDENVNQSSLFCLIKKCELCFIFQHILHVFPCIMVLLISLWVDHELCGLSSTQYNVPHLFVRIFVGRPRFVVYPTCPICNHDFLYVCYLGRP